MSMLIDRETYSRIKELQIAQYMNEEDPYIHREELHDNTDRYYTYTKHWNEWKSEKLRDLWMDRLEQQ